MLKLHWLVVIVAIFLTLRLGTLLTASEAVRNQEETYRGTIARQLLDGLAAPFASYRADEYELGSLLVGLLAAPLFRVFGESLFALKLVPLLCSLATLLGVFLLVVRWFGVRTALAAAALFVFAPPGFVRLSLTAIGSHAQSLVACVAILACFFAAVDRPRAWAPRVLFALLSVVAIVVAPSTGLTVVTCVVAAVAIPSVRASDRGRLLAVAAIALLAVLAGDALRGFGVVHFLSQLGSVRAVAEHAASPSRDWSWIIVAPTRRLIELVTIAIPRSPEFPSPPWLPRFTLSYGYAALVVVALASGAWRRLIRDPRLLTLVLFVPVFVIIYVLSGIEIPREGPADNFRYFVPLQLVVLMILAIVLVDGRRRRLLLLLLVTFGALGQSALLFREPFGRALEYQGHSYLELGRLWQNDVGGAADTLITLLPRLERVPEGDRPPTFWGMTQATRFSATDLAPARVAELLRAIPPAHRRYVVLALGRDLDLATPNAAERLAAVGSVVDPREAAYLYDGAYEALVATAARGNWDVPSFLAAARPLGVPKFGDRFQFAVGRVAAVARDPACVELDRYLGVIDAEQRRWVYRGFGDVVGEQWLWYPERGRDDAQCKPGRPATRGSAGIDRLASAVSLPPGDRADLFWGVGWCVRVEFAEDRRRALDWIARLPAEARSDAMSGFEAAERWFGLAAESGQRADALDFGDRSSLSLGHKPPMNVGHRYERDLDIVYRRIVDEVVLLPIRHNFGDLESIFTLNEVGARIWDLLDGRRTLVEITDIIMSEFDVTADVATDDLEEFVRDLEGVGAVHMVAA